MLLPVHYPVPQRNSRNNPKLINPHSGIGLRVNCVSACQRFCNFTLTLPEHKPRILAWEAKQMRMTKRQESIQRGGAVQSGAGLRQLTLN